MSGPPDFFISYTPTDEKWAVWIAATLENAGFRTMLQAWDFVPSDNFIERIDSGITESSVIIAVLSPRYLQSRYGRMEWQSAFRSSPDDPQRRLLPILVEDCELDGLLAQITYLDLVGVLDRRDAEELLLKRVRAALAGRIRPEAPPAFPRTPASASGRQPRRIPMTMPMFPLDRAPRVEGPVSILHVAGPSFGRDVAVTPTRIVGQVRRMEDAGAPPPVLLVIPGGLTADAAKHDFERAAEFIHELRTGLDLRPDRVVIVPGPGDVSMKQLETYFIECEDEGVPAIPPYHRKWKRFEALFSAFYEGMNGTYFGAGAPWTKFTVPDLRIAVAGFNTTYAMTTRENGRRGCIGDEQTNAFSPWLRDQERLGWLRIGVMAHAPVVDQLDNAEDFRTDLTGHLNLLLHGGRIDVESPQVPALSLPDAGRAEIVTVTPDGYTRWGPSQPPFRVRCGWQDADAAFGEDREARLADDPRITTDPTTSLLQRLREACEVRYTNPRIRLIDQSPPYLNITYAVDRVVVRTCLVPHAGTPALDDVDHALRIAAEQEGQVELIYTGDRPPDDVFARARSGMVEVRSLIEFQGLLDLRDYVAKQTAGLLDNRVYPPGLYVPQRFSVVGRADQPAGDDLVAEVLETLRSDEGQFVLLLADFGSGKTFSMRELARRAPDELPDVIPMLIEMRKLEKDHSIEELIASHLAERGERKVDLAAFDYMLREGRILLLFDGFDELLTRTTYERAADRLDMVLNAAVGKAKIVLTSRSQHFQSQEQVFTALGERVGRLPQQRVFSIQRFTDADIRTYLFNHFGHDAQKADERLRLLRGVDNLTTLAQNPRMLSFIAQLDLGRLREVADEGRVLSAAGLYKEILTAWLAHEEQRQANNNTTRTRGLTIDQMWFAVTQLAIRLWESGEELLSPPDIAEIAATLDSIAEAAMSTDEATQAIGSGTLLVRTEADLFGFIHTSVMEWLIAQEIARRLDGGEDNPALLAQRLLTQLTIDFLCDLAQSDKCTAWAEGNVGNDTLAQDNAKRMLGRLNAPSTRVLERTDLSGVDWSNRELPAIKLAGARIVDALLQDSNLTGADLSGASLDGSRLDRSLLNGANLRRASMRRTRLVGADLTDVMIEHGDWYRAAVVAAVGDEPLRTAPELRQASVIPRDPIDVQLMPSVVSVPYGFDIKFGRLPQNLAYSEEGDLLAIGCDDGGVLVHDVVGVRIIRTLVGHRDRVYGVAALSDARFVSVSADRTVRCWNALTGAEIWQYGGLTDWAWPLTVDHRSNAVVVGDRTGAVFLLDAATGELTWKIEDLPGTVWTAAFSSDDQLLAVGGSDAMVRVFDVSTGRLLWKHPADRNVYRVAISARGGLLAASDDAGVIQVWRVSDGTPVSTLTGHEQAVYTIDLHSNGWLLASGDTSGLINLWDVRSGHLLKSLPHHQKKVVYQVRFSHKGKLMVSSDSDGGCQVWSLDAADGAASIRPLVGLAGHVSSVWPPVFRNDDQEIATASNDESVRLWNVGTGQCTAEIRGHGRQISTLSFNGTGGMVAVAGKDGLVRIWNSRTGKQLHCLSGRANQLVSAVFSPVADTVVTGTNDGGAQRFNAETGQIERELKLKTVSVWAEAFSPNGEVVATANDDDSVSLWNHRTGAQNHNLQPHKGRVRSIAFAPQNDLLATGCDDGKVRIWSVGEGVCTQTLEGHTDRVYGVGFNHDGTLLASGGWDGTLRIWSRDGWRLLRTLTGHGGRLWAVAHHPTLDVVACAGDDARIHVWDSVAGRKLTALDAHLGKVSAITFSPDGGLLASGGYDGVVRIWDTTDPSAPILKVTLIGQGKGWAAVSPQGRYKVHDLQGAFWYAVGGCRFEAGELDALVPDVARMFMSQEF
ncbi:TIR domain-containing protein [Streptomyces sp. SL13]|uniref:TIR domain-containing protein n=1 Tax=Streptantibioticus silvisoli TaxID=2705255 RepID=A0AA90HAC3_9ACTN|nr:TIR domain-containing protein [Streptantibioticus silvisoli]MDI5974155.1 TIR domain-containing protein [Streptantibioticus silvisoli]